MVNRGMENTIFSKFLYFVAGVVIGALLEATICLPGSHTPPAVEHVSTNTLVQVVGETNRASQVQQPDWFKDNSNYIWDGWKIK